MAASGDGEFLTQAATYLGAAAIAVPIFNRFKLGSILGYLAAGVAVGPSALNLLPQEEGVFHIAELGVVLFLFVIGLELSLARLWALRRDIFGLGAAQMALTGVVIAAAFVAADVMATPAAIVAGLALAFSSTAFALQFMKDRGELTSAYGRRAFPVLLFQDLAVIPVLAALPIVGAGMSLGDAMGPSALAGAAQAVVVVAVIVLVGKYGLNPLLRLVAGSGSREAFAAMALFLVAAVSLAVSWAGLSMALGAFLAGALLAESAYARQIETDIEPFRGLLLGLFFISIGMRLDLSLIASNWVVVIGGALGLALLKALLLTGLARVFGASTPDAVKTGAVLSQGGEFAFVVFTLGADAALFTNGQATLLSAMVTISMALTPFAMIAARRLADTREAQSPAFDGARAGDGHATEGHVIVGGFGRMGQIISQVLQNSGVDVVAIDRDGGHIRNAERFGFKVYFGDAARLDVLTTAGAGDARAIILTMDDASAVNEATGGLRAKWPNLPIFAVAHDRFHEIQLKPLDPTLIVRETMESSLTVARAALREIGFADALVEDYIDQFRARDRERLLAQIDDGVEAGKEMLHRPFETTRSDARAT